MTLRTICRPGVSFFLLCSSPALAQSAPKWSVISSPDGSANLRAAPNGALVAPLPNGTLINISSVANSWGRISGVVAPEAVREFDGAAYLHSSQVVCAAGVFHWCAVQSAEGSSNVRSEARSGSTVISTLQNGDLVKISENRQGWYKLKNFVLRGDSQAMAGYIHASMAFPSVFRSEVPYYCQHLNDYKPASTCGNTSMAMALSAVLGKSISADYLWSYNESKFGYNFANSRDRFAEIARSLGAKTSRAAVLNATQMKAELDKGRLLVMQGYFTNSYGHIILITGYTSSGFVINDSNGKWAGGSMGSGYNHCSGSNSSGRQVVYSFADVARQSLLNPNFSVGVISRD